MKDTSMDETRILERPLRFHPETTIWRERSLWCGAGALVWIAAVFGMVAMSSDGGDSIAFFSVFLLAVPAVLAFLCGFWWRGAIPTTLIRWEVYGEDCKVTITDRPRVFVRPDTDPA